MSTNVQNGATFNAHTGFKYAAPKANKSGGKSVGIQSTKDNKSLHISTPLMMTWGCSGYESPQTGRIESYDLSLQFPREQDGNFNEDTQAFLQAMKDYEERIKNDAVTNSKDWFGKSKMSKEVVNALFTPMLKYPKDKDTGDFDYTRTPTLRVKVPFYDNTFRAEIYNLDQEMIFPNPDQPNLTPVELIQKTQNVALVMQSGGVWFANGKFGTTWRLVQAVVQPKASILGNRKCHVLLNSSARATLTAERDADDDASESSAVAATTVESSEDEEPTPAPDPVPEPTPAPKKKVVRKKKVVTAN
ncbi:MAG: hypothetical protein ACR2M6_00635 [Vampirovibrionia bacterium]